MKCEHCGKNEAVFYYKSSVNGVVVERRLCPVCAAKLQKEVETGRELDALRDFFFPSAIQGWMVLPVLLADAGQGESRAEEGDFSPWSPEDGEKEAGGPPERDIPGQVGLKLKNKRELFLLQNQLTAAVGAQEFEKAAALRDQIRKLERDSGGNAG